jgi:hypothetical protein
MASSALSIRLNLAIAVRPVASGLVVDALVQLTMRQEPAQ